MLKYIDMGVNIHRGQGCGQASTLPCGVRDKQNGGRLNEFDNDHGFLRQTAVSSPPRQAAR
eukprot:m.22168 g.22168  ORF g.22168 m.22168 type:complete len:61 (+) comp7363_c0_seq1:43-225(+)